MFCPHCGKEMPVDAIACTGCGRALPQVARSSPEESSKSRLVTTLLAFFLGGLGIHRFYLGKTGTGIAMLFTLGGLGIWALVDFIMAAAGSMKDSKGLPVRNWETT